MTTVHNMYKNVVSDLDRALCRFQTEAGHCSGSVQFRSGLSGASQALMFMQSGGLASHRGPISVIGSVTGPPRQLSALAWWMTLSPGSGWWKTALCYVPHLCSPWHRMPCGHSLELLVKPQIKSFSQVPRFCHCAYNGPRWKRSTSANEGVH